MVLVVLLVDGRDLPLAERVVEGVVNGRGRDAQARGGVAVDDHVGLQAARLLVAADVAAAAGVWRSLSTSIGGPVVEFVEVAGLQRVLVLRLARCGRRRGCPAMACRNKRDADDTGQSSGAAGR